MLVWFGEERSCGGGKLMKNGGGWLFRVFSVVHWWWEWRSLWVSAIAGVGDGLVILGGIAILCTFLSILNVNLMGELKHQKK